jgi:antitoxin HigA-1
LQVDYDLWQARKHAPKKVKPAPMPDGLRAVA